MRRTNDTRNGRRRLFLAAGTMLAAGALLTAATATDASQVEVALDGSSHRFDLMVSGSSAHGWRPSDTSWEQGNPESFQISLNRHDATLAPGGALTVRVAVRNASPSLAGHLELAIRDPLPRGTATDPVTGTYLELFDRLEFTAIEADGTVVFDQVPASGLTSYRWADDFGPGDVKLLDIRIALPAEVDNRWQGATTDIQFHFEAENT